MCLSSILVLLLVIANVTSELDHKCSRFYRAIKDEVWLRDKRLVLKQDPLNCTTLVSSNAVLRLGLVRKQLNLWYNKGLSGGDISELN
jgi:hypothetical protein